MIDRADVLALFSSQFWVADIAQLRALGIGPRTITRARRRGTIVGVLHNANLRGIACKSLTLSISGSGNAAMSGTADKVTARISGAGDIDAAGLQSKAADVQVSGAGNASVWATDELKVRVSGAGDVKYKGSPKIEQKVSGAGKVRSMN